jgi:predicted outer membrane repeat protein|uniref:Uncharacterized protein n=1 Tax=Phaeodactylum tricornutum TaxID=2850 RepID=A0A8J9S388_PHATR
MHTAKVVQRFSFCRLLQQWLLLGTLLAGRPGVSAFCDELSDPSWDSLVDWMTLVEPLGFGIVCPFQISGSACPKIETSFEVTSPNFYIICANFLGGSGDSCLLDCPSTHISIAPYSQLILEGWTLRSTKGTPAVVVESNAEFVAYGSTFENNQNTVGNGGAIFADTYSTVVLEDSSFVENFALNGGALYSLGTVVIVNGNFQRNKAIESGGAVYLDGPLGSSASIRTSRWEGNRARVIGPSVFQNSTDVAIQTQGNTACNNLNFEALSYCDGIEDGSRKCLPFGEKCTFSTSAPTSIPTLTQSLVPTSSSIESPTQILASRPSLRPTLAGATPTVTPINTPSDVPSLVEAATLSTAVPAGLDFTSDAPSPVPLTPVPTRMLSNIPSDVPSLVPTSKASTDVLTAKVFTSGVPSLIPTIINRE